MAKRSRRPPWHASNGRSGSPVSRATPTRSRCTTTGRPRAGCSTTRWNTSSASIWTSPSRHTAPARSPCRPDPAADLRSPAEAHELGLIYRDIKPANIILTSRDGTADFVKVLDFGLVKAARAGESYRSTQTNVTVGTPHYLSPEAVETPDGVTDQSDIDAIGAVAYY